MKWKGKLIEIIKNELKDDIKWTHIIEKALSGSRIGIHLAIFNEPFLALVYKGEKVMESRFSINKISPFMKVAKGDIVILKNSGGTITGIFIAGKVIYYSNLNKAILKNIRLTYGFQICSHYDDKFWVNREKSNYATLIEVKDVRALAPFRIEKNDRSAWSVIKQGYHDLI